MDNVDLSLHASGFNEIDIKNGIIDLYGYPKTIEFNYISPPENHNLGGKYAEFEYKFFRSKGYQSDMTSLSKKYDRIVVLIDSSIRDLKEEIKDVTSETHNIIAFNNVSKTIMKKFRTEDTVVFCTYKTASEGINFSEADCMVCYGYGSNSLEKAKQVLGRVKRLNNTEEKIDIYFDLSRNPVEYITTKLNYYYATNKVKWFTKKTQETMEYIAREVDITKLNMQEMLILMTTGQHTFKNFKSNIPLDKLLTLAHL